MPGVDFPLTSNERGSHREGWKHHTLAFYRKHDLISCVILLLQEMHLDLRMFRYLYWKTVCFTGSPYPCYFQTWEV